MMANSVVRMTPNVKNMPKPIRWYNRVNPGWIGNRRKITNYSLEL
jgi:hypothetical protein